MLTHCKLITANSHTPTQTHKHTEKPTHATAYFKENEGGKNKTKNEQFFIKFFLIISFNS